MTQPTIGSNAGISGNFPHLRGGSGVASEVEEVKHENITFQVWDLGGQELLCRCGVGLWIFSTSKNLEKNRRP